VEDDDPTKKPLEFPNFICSVIRGVHVDAVICNIRSRIHKMRILLSNIRESNIRICIMILLTAPAQLLSAISIFGNGPFGPILKLQIFLGLNTFFIPKF
jgi:hypothetical protein